MKSSIFKISATLVLLAVIANSPVSAGTLSEEMATKAKLVATYLKEGDVNTVTMQPIDGPSRATGINRIGVELESHLKKNGVSLESDSDLSIAVRVSFSKNKTIPDGLEITISIRDSNGDTIVKFPTSLSASDAQSGFDGSGNTMAKIDDPDEVQQIIAVPVSTHDLNIQLDTETSGDEAHDLAEAQKFIAINEAAKSPKNKTFIKNNRVSSSSSHIFEAELVRTQSNNSNPDKNSYQVVPVSLAPKTGFAMATLQPGDNIGVRIYNNSPNRVAADACLDGISSFHFFTQKKISPYYAIRPGGNYLLRGFLKNLDSANKATYSHFQIVQFEDTVWNKARRAGQSVSTKAFGSIAVHISREFEPVVTKGGGPGIGEGKIFDEKVKTTKMHVGSIIETIVIRYQKP